MVRRRKGNLSIKLQQQLIERSDNRCEKCGIIYEDSVFGLENHHIIPVALGGSNDPNNLSRLCNFCHSLAGIYITKEEFEIWLNDPRIIISESVDSQLNHIFIKDRVFFYKNIIRHFKRRLKNVE